MKPFLTIRTFTASGYKSRDVPGKLLGWNGRLCEVDFGNGPGQFFDPELLTWSNP